MFQLSGFYFRVWVWGSILPMCLKDNSKGMEVSMIDVSDCLAR